MLKRHDGQNFRSQRTQVGLAFGSRNGMDFQGLRDVLRSCSALE